MAKHLKNHGVGNKWPKISHENNKDKDNGSSINTVKSLFPIMANFIWTTEIL